MTGDEFKELLGRAKAGFKDRYSEGREDYRQAYYAAREMQRKDPEDARIKTTLATNPTFVTARDLLGTSEPIYKGQRAERGMALSDDRATRIGQVLGTIGNDLTQDNSRSLWWLLNAPQATGNVINEYALSKAQPNLFAHEALDIEVPTMENTSAGPKPKVYKDAALTRENKSRYDSALSAGVISAEGIKRKGIGQKDGKYTRRKFSPGDVAALSIPTGVAINAGIGLLNPFGGSGGYSAALPSDEDPSKTENVLMEVGAKYILGRTGNLLPYDEFSKHRPDVSRGEYNAYKAFKYQKDGDFDLSDGDFTVPTGVIKGTMDGIHGPEVQFLGRSLPLTTTVIPYLGALAGGVSGVRTARPIKGGLIRGSAGLAAGAVTGMITEELRRRASSNQSLGQGGSAEQYL